MSTPSVPDPGADEGIAPQAAAADASLSDVAYTHRGLDYPHGRSGPGPGELIAVAGHVGWARLPLPGSLGHINVWILDDGDGVALVDTGLASDESRAAWTALFDGPLASRRPSRVFVTHFHPDHLGLAGWLCGRFAAPLWMSRGEWTFARMLTADVREAPPPEAFAFWRLAGWSEDQVAAEAAKGWGRFAAMVSPIPASYVRLRDGEAVAIGGRQWRVVVGSGHSPEHACLLDPEAKLLVAGDQVLPRITSNVSLNLSEPEADPLGEWLDSIARLKVLPDDLLVLPAHGEPFFGLHKRLDALAAGHRDRLDALHVFLEEPRRAVDCFTTLFGRRIPDSALGLATGEALAHLRRLEVEGRCTRETQDGTAWFVARSA